MNKNIQNKAKLIAPYIKGDAADLGSEDVNWDESLHNNIEKLGKKMLRVDFYGNPDVKANLNERSPFPNERFDTILASEIIEHLDNPLYFLKECKRILKPNGTIILTTPNAISFSEWQGALSQRHHKKVYTEHLYNWHKVNMENLIERAGLKVKEFRYISLYWNRNYLLRLLAWYFPMFSPTLFFVLKK